jgi:thiol-disulfide isomerase/thioredoxin
VESPRSRQSKWIIAAVVVAALAALFWPRGDGTFEAPGGFLYDAEGRPATLGERLAPVTLLHFWATWCPPCLTEVPSLHRLGTDTMGDEAFVILMVSVADDREKVENFLGNRSFSVYYDPAWEVTHRYGTRKLPETYLLVGNTVVDHYIGATDWDAPEVRQRLAEKVREHREQVPNFLSSGP